jgi:hypothetical protein
MAYQYWKNEAEFRRQSQLLQDLFNEQEEHYGKDKTTQVSLLELAKRQRDKEIGCIYLAGGRIDNKACLGSENVGILFSSLPTDYAKAIAPAFHADHDELIVCTAGQVVVEYATSLDSNAVIETIVLIPGEYFIAKAKWPHRISLAPLRMFIIEKENQVVLDESQIDQVSASFLAIKMGSLRGKGLYEDMTKWPHKSFHHPIIAKWRIDDAVMRKVRRTPEVCKRLHIPPLENKEK